MAYEQDILVSYGGFTFPAPTPYVSKTYTNQMVGGDLLVTAIEVTLSGQIAVLPERDSTLDNTNHFYGVLKDKRNEVAKAFAGALGKNYQTLTITGHGENFTLENCSVTNVSFNSSDYKGLVDYTISLTGYDDTNSFVAANYGVVNPVDSWAYSEEQGSASLTHTISAQGYNCGGDNTYNAFIKAKTFVESKKGVSGKVAPLLIRNAHPDSSLILTSVSEQADRFSGSYAITENYSFATNESQTKAGSENALPIMQTSNILLTYSLSIDEQQGGDFVTVGLSGNIVGTKDEAVNWDQIKADFKSRDFYDLANQAYKNYIQRTGTNLELNKSPITFSINPNEEARTISFNLSFDNNDLYSRAKIKNNDGSYFDYSISFQHDNVTDIVTVNCNGTIRTRAALHKRNSAAKTLLDNEILANNSKAIRDEAQAIYRDMFPKRVNYSLSPRPINEQINQNTFDGIITYSASFSDEDFPEDANLSALSYSVDVKPAMQQYRPIPSCQSDGHYLIYDLALEKIREDLSINVQGSSFKKDLSTFSSSVSEISSVSDFLKESFVDGEVPRLDSENKVENRELGAITFNRTISHEKPTESVRLERLLS
tara:strand:- start:2318 stop:4111 length:1794 start_codon:yes stop_codon:yes gene_type:complete